MPYIVPINRDRLDPLIGKLVIAIGNVGELNYVLTKLAASTCDVIKTYRNIADAVAVLECAKLELYRRLAAPYEDRKIAENGDIPEYMEKQDGPREQVLLRNVPGIRICLLRRLENLGYQTVADLHRLSRYAVKLLRGIGSVGIRDIEAIMEQYGVSYTPDTEKQNGTT